MNLSLRDTVADVLELLGRSWNITINYAQHSVNLVAAVLAFTQKERSDILVIHAEPPRQIQLALDLDIHTCQLAQQLQVAEDAQATLD